MDLDERDKLLTSPFYFFYFPAKVVEPLVGEPRVIGEDLLGPSRIRLIHK